MENAGYNIGLPAAKMGMHLEEPILQHTKQFSGNLWKSDRGILPLLILYKFTPDRFLFIAFFVFLSIIDSEGGIDNGTGNF